MKKIPSLLFRGGTSKGPFFLRSDLPSDPTERDRLLLRLMGSPDPRQIDGIGGGDSLSSKVAIVSLSERADADLNYLFCQVYVDKAQVGTALNCGNMLSAVAPFAIERGLIRTTDPETTVRIYNENTGVIVVATVQTPGGKITYAGDTAIDGVPGTAAPIQLSFTHPVGEKLGKLLPTGHAIDNIDGIAVTCIDVAVPMVLFQASALGKTGLESKTELDADTDFLAKLEALREAAAIKMGLGDVHDSVSPKVSMVAAPVAGGTINSHYFTPFDCHAAHAVSGALCVSAACLIPGSVANQLAAITPLTEPREDKAICIEHPSGHIDVVITADQTSGQLDFPQAAFIRTARPLFDGWVIA